MKVVTFLQARLKADELAVLGTDDDAWDLNEWATGPCADLGSRMAPSRVRAEIAVKRAILDEYKTTLNIRDMAAHQMSLDLAEDRKTLSVVTDEWDRATRELRVYHVVLNLLALAYCSHPDYQRLVLL